MVFVALAHERTVRIALVSARALADILGLSKLGLHGLVLGGQEDDFGIGCLGHCLHGLERRNMSAWIDRCFGNKEGNKGGPNICDFTGVKHKASSSTEIGYSPRGSESASQLDCSGYRPPSSSALRLRLRPWLE